MSSTVTSASDWNSVKTPIELVLGVDVVGVRFQVPKKLGFQPDDNRRDSIFLRLIFLFGCCGIAFDTHIVVYK